MKKKAALLKNALSPEFLMHASQVAGQQSKNILSSLPNDSNRLAMQTKGIKKLNQSSKFLRAT